MLLNKKLVSIEKMHRVRKMPGAQTYINKNTFSSNMLPISNIKITCLILHNDCVYKQYTKTTGEKCCVRTKYTSPEVAKRIINNLLQAVTLEEFINEGIEINLELSIN